MTKGFIVNCDKNLLIYFFSVKGLAKRTFWKMSKAELVFWHLTMLVQILYQVLKLQIRGGIHIIFFLFLDENICCGYSLEAPRWGASNKYPQHMFSLRNKKDISIFRMKKVPYLLLWSLFHYLLMWLKTAGWVASSTDPDRTSHSVVSDLGLYCLHRSVCPNTQGMVISKRNSELTTYMKSIFTLNILTLA